VIRPVVGLVAEKLVATVEKLAKEVGLGHHNLLVDLVVLMEKVVWRCRVEMEFLL